MKSRYPEQSRQHRSARTHYDEPKPRETTGGARTDRGRSSGADHFDEPQRVDVRRPRRASHDDGSYDGGRAGGHTGSRELGLEGRAGEHRSMAQMNGWVQEEAVPSAPEVQLHLGHDRRATPRGQAASGRERRGSAGDVRAAADQEFPVAREQRSAQLGRGNVRGALQQHLQYARTENRNETSRGNSIARSNPVQEDLYEKQRQRDAMSQQLEQLQQMRRR